MALPSAPSELLVALLAGHATTAHLPTPVARSLAEAADTHEVRGGTVLASEGETTDAVSFVVEGRADASVGAAGAVVPVAVLHEGDCYGLGSLAAGDHVHEATVVATERVVIADIPAAAFESAAKLHPEAVGDLEAAVESLHLMRFLKLRSPFSPLDPDALAALADHVQYRELPAQTPAISQGTPASECLLLLEGQAEVRTDDSDGARRRLASVYPGGLVGEGALLEGGVYDLTVETTAASRWLVIHRDELIDAMRSSRPEVAAIAEAIALSGRPVRHPGVELHTVPTRHGETVAVLKDPVRGIYHRCSRYGAFLWERMDGHHTVKDLTLDLFEQSHQFQPHVVGSSVAALAADGLVDGVSLPPTVLASLPALPLSQRLLIAARRALEAKVVVPRIDRPLRPLWRFPVRFLYTRLGLVLLAAIAVGGLAVFGTEAGHAKEHASGWALGIGLAVGYIGSVLFHEAGHAFTTIRFGRELSRGGFGWYWFGPVAFVDTTDMWLAPRSQRIAVSLAGPTASLIAGSTLALVALPLDAGGTKAILLTLVLFNYGMVLLNLNPLLEYDGYYALMDALDRPNLRREALRWLPKGLPAAVRQRSPRGHTVELTYGLASLIYVVAMAVVTVVVYRLLLEHLIARAIPSAVASGLGWGLAAVIVVLASAGAIQDMRAIPGTE